MSRHLLLVFIFAIFPPSLHAASPLTEANLRLISNELAQASAAQDTQVLEKYFYPGSKVVLAPEPSKPQQSKQYSFAEYLELTKTSLRLVESKRTVDEILSIKIDKKRQRAHVKERLTSFTQTMGLTLKDVVLSNTTYGVVDHQVKVLSTHLRWLSSETQ